MSKGSKKKILYVSAEVSPYAKTGGLADVAGSLPEELARLGHDVRVVMPKYKSIKQKSKYVTDFPFVMNGKTKSCIIKETSDRVPVYLVESYEYYFREGIYCHPDDGERFAYFCHGILEMLPRIGFKPDIIHLNDWHTGPVAMILKENYADKPFYSDIRALYTIHNLEYQGLFGEDILDYLNLDHRVFTQEKAEFYGMVNFMKTGIVYSDIVNTVSSKYANEIQTPEYGEGLDGLLRSRTKDLYGIVNGISYDEFNPETDGRIYKNYTIDTIDLKRENKTALQEEMGLPRGDYPLIGVVSRLSSQKGLDLIADRLDEILKGDVQFVLLGTGDPYYESIFENIRSKNPDKVALYIGFDATLAQRIYAGADMFLMPSRFEPCGLGQLISLRYGTIPVVRATGGLGETIRDYGNGKGNGFSFEDYSSQQFYDALSRAIDLYTNEPDKFAELRIRAMEEDFSWTRSAREYEKLYDLAINQGKY